TLEARVTGSEVETGFSSWPESIKENLLLVDKSFILRRIILDKSPILLTRPRRFGKTMCLTMSEDFFGVPRGETLKKKQARYRKMDIGADPKFIKKHCGQYPVIKLDLKASDALPPWHIADLLRRFPEIDEDVGKKVEKDEADKKAKKKAKNEVGKKDDEEVDEKTEAANRIRLLSDLKESLDEKRTLMKTKVNSCTMLLKSLVQFLNAYYRKECILLIDEFDAPILAASKDNRDTIRRHMRNMLSPVVKPGTERLLSKFLMVGVNPINLAELGSSLNNVKTLSLHSASQESYTDNLLEVGNMPYQVAFGFTEDEVRRLIATRVFPDNEAMVDVALNVARSWYDGYYVFKNYRIYNPWSVMNFIESLVNSKTCSNEAEVLAKAQPYWIDTGGTELLTDMYNELKKINPSIPRVILRMCIDYLSLKNSIEPSDSPRTSIRVELINSFTQEHTTQKNVTTYFGEQTEEITVFIARLNRGSMTENPTLNKFITMAYHFGYLTIIDEKYIAIPNREVLTFWAQLITDETDNLEEPLVFQEARKLTGFLVSGDIDGFSDALGRHFLDPLIKADVGAREYYYHEIMFMQICLGIDSSKYICRAEVSAASGKANICIIPKAKGGTGILIEIKRASSKGVIDGACSSGSQGVQESPQPAAPLFRSRQTHQDLQRAFPSPSAGSGGTAGSKDKDGTVDFTKAPYPPLKECLKVGIAQIEEKRYLRVFYVHCTKVLGVVPAFCGRKYLVSSKNYDSPAEISLPGDSTPRQDAPHTRLSPPGASPPRRGASSRRAHSACTPVDIATFNHGPLLLQAQFSTEGEKAIHDKLLEELELTSLQVTDISGGCGSMYAVEIEAPAFKGKNAVQQHRLVNKVLKEELKHMHGLRIISRPPPPPPPPNE
ncbi:hypothetical protein EV182_000352, partial [Spiromyces aspiralis]